MSLMRWPRTTTSSPTSGAAGALSWERAVAIDTPAAKPASMQNVRIIPFAFTAMTFRGGYCERFSPTVHPAPRQATRLMASQ
jgi:hypothetical protein